MRVEIVGFVFTLLCSYVVSSKVGYLHSDPDSDRYNVSKLTRKYLLENLKNRFNGGTTYKTPIENDQDFPQLDPNCESPEILKIWHIPKSVQFIIEKYLNTKDSYNLFYTCKYYNGIVREAAETNLSLFCPHFVLPDPILNRIFYFGIIKYLNVDSVSDEKVLDALQLFYFQLKFKAIKCPKRVSGDIIWQMLLFLHEAVYGEGSRTFSLGLPLFRQFTDQIQTRAFPMTMHFLEKEKETSEYASDFFKGIKYILSNPSDSDLRQKFELPDYNPAITVAEERALVEKHCRLINYITKYYAERLHLDFDSAQIYEKFFELLSEDMFIPEIFERIVQDTATFLVDAETCNVYNSDFLLALLQKDPEASKQKAAYVLTRTVTDQFDYEHFSSLEGGDTVYFMLCSWINSPSINMTQLDIFSQLVRSGDIDFNKLNAPHRSSLLEKLLKSRFMSEMLQIVLHESPKSINLLVVVSKLPGETHFCPISDYFKQYPQRQYTFVISILQHFLSKSDDPLPLLLLPVNALSEVAGDHIRDKFNLNKKYLIDYDMNQIKISAIKIPEHQFENYYGQVIDFKTIIKTLQVDYEDIRSYFTSDTTKFDEPTPEEVRPISLQSFFEKVVFEEVDL